MAGSPETEFGRTAARHVHEFNFPTVLAPSVPKVPICEIGII